MDNREAEIAAWERELDRDARLADQHLAIRLGRYSRLRWADWASKRKVAQTDLATADRRLRELFGEVALLRREREALIKRVAELRGDQ